MIQSVGQTVLNKKPDSCSIVLSCPEFDFYAQKLIEFHGLKSDTGFLGNQIKSLSKINKQQVKLLSEDSLVVKKKDQTITLWKEDFGKLDKLYIKEQKKTKRIRTIAFTGWIVSCVLAIIIVLTH